MITGSSEASVLTPFMTLHCGSRDYISHERALLSTCQGNVVIVHWTRG